MVWAISLRGEGLCPSRELISPFSLIFASESQTLLSAWDCHEELGLCL